MDQDQNKVVNLTKEADANHSISKPIVENKNNPKSTRHDMQFGRRFFHMGMGVMVSGIYWLLVTHQQAVYILGTCACILYVLEQIRINYPSVATKFSRYTKYVLRAEEQLQESAAIPYVFAILLTIISFPKIIAICAILTLAIADPMSALIGIKFGSTKLIENKSLQGSLAFFFAAFFCTLLPFMALYTSADPRVWILAFLSSLSVSLFEMIPLKLDDNLTIPLFSAFILWILSGLLSMNVSSLVF